VDAVLLNVLVLSEEGVFTVRRRARDVAGLVGLDAQDQVRVATALGEVGREALSWWGGAAITFSVRELPTPALVVRVQAAPSVDPAASHDVPDRRDPGLSAAARLLDEVVVLPPEQGAIPAVLLAKCLPATHTVLRDGEIDAVKARLAGFGPASPFEELRAQNGELLAALDALTVQKYELVELNAELEETNRGVMAMYTQLSEELEETNRGVVALYAELEEKGEQIQEASEAKSRFLASVSHELRSPVNSILGLTRLLADPDGGPLTDEQSHQVGLVASTARSLLGLVNGLLDLAKAESGRIEPAISAVDLRTVFAALRSTVAPLVESAAVTLVVEEPAGDLRLRSDEQLITHILRNLLTNAVKFTERGEVVMRAARRESAQHIEITVTDTGIGIDAAHQARVFEEFYQVPNPLQTRTRGTGLGLPYVRRIAGLLGGEVQLTSSPGEGTEVTVRLPIEWTALLAPEVTPPAGTPVVGSEHVGTVLVVDDDGVFRHVLRGMLQGRADRILEAADGLEAIHLLRTTPVDVVFLDLHMPVLDGRRVLDHLATDASLGTPAVLVVTSLDPASIDPPLSGPNLTVMSKSDLSSVAMDDILRRARSGPA
jgi:signal transduction histidine kinase/CheY-like chemotaxis protein